jgi:hypothetical protein
MFLFVVKSTPASLVSAMVIGLAYYCTPNNWMSKISVALGGIAPG